MASVFRFVTIILTSFCVVCVLSCSASDRENHTGEGPLVTDGAHCIAEWVLACRSGNGGFGCWPGDSAFTSLTSRRLAEDRSTASGRLRGGGGAAAARKTTVSRLRCRHYGGDAPPRRAHAAAAGQNGRRVGPLGKRAPRSRRSRPTAQARARRGPGPREPCRCRSLRAGRSLTVQAASTQV